MNISSCTKLVFLFASLSITGTAFSVETTSTPEEQLVSPEKNKDKQSLENVALDDNEDHIDSSTDVSSSKSVKIRDNEPTVAVIPDQREPETLSERELRFAEIKRALQGPEGSLHLSKIENYVAIYPEHLQARLWLIRTQLLAKQHDKALNSIGESANWYDPDWQASFWKAQVYLHHGQLDRARQAMDYVLATDSDSPEVWVQQAVLEQEANNHVGAVQLLQIALEVDPKYAIAELNLGMSLEHLKQYQAALRAYQRYLSSGNATDSTLRLNILQRVELLARFIMQNNSENSATF